MSEVKMEVDELFNHMHMQNMDSKNLYGSVLSNYKCMIDSQMKKINDINSPGIASDIANILERKRYIMGGLTPWGTEIYCGNTEITPEIIAKSKQYIAKYVEDQNATLIVRAKAIAKELGFNQ